MAQLSMNETTTFRWSFEQDVSHYAAASIPAIGVWREKLSDYGEARGADLLRSHNLAVSHLFWAGGFTGSDGRTFRQSVEDAADALRTAAAIGTKCLVVYSGARANHTYNHARRLFRDALKELAPVAAGFGLVLAVEPMHPGCATEFTFLTNLDEVLELLAALDSPQVKVVFDTYHLGQDPAVLGQVRSLAPHVAIVQLGDAKQPPRGEQNRCRLGDGVVPLKEIVQALTAAGYDGYYDVELLGEEIESMDYPSLLDHAKQAFESLVLRA
ncbi:MAG: sugar phosphate isomerase/epimerase [Pirellulales bacterium]|nr:sugar phosphate isomerase/epimerase [Pirellulales bacterium]